MSIAGHENGNGTGASAAAPDGATCPDDEALAALLDGAISDEARATIEAHAVHCSPCRGLLADCATALTSMPEARILPLRPVAGARGRPSEPTLSPRWVAAAAAILVTGGVVGVGFGPLSSRSAVPLVSPEVQVAAATVSSMKPASSARSTSSSTTLVSSTSGRVEVRVPGETGWVEVVGGAVLPAGSELRAIGAESSELSLEGGLALSLRRETRAVLWPREEGLVLALAQGAIAAGPMSPGAKSRLRIETPQGVVTSDGAPFEVHVQRRRPTLVLAREGAGVACETPFGIVGVAGSEHTLLFDDRPSPRARRSELKDGDERPGGRGRGRGRGHDGRGPDGRDGERRGGCKPPGGPELEKLWKDGEGPT